MADEVAKGEVQFFYEKSNFFRVIHADGAYGGSTPTGDLHIAFYNERHPIPKVTVLPLEDSRPAGREVVKEQKPGVFREVEVDVVMSISVALAFQSWFDEKLEALRQQQKISDADWDAIRESYRAK